MAMDKVYSGWYARLYDLPFGRVFKEGRHRTIELLELQPGHRVLEVGIGTGLTMPLYPQSVDVCGIDIARDMMQGAIQRRQNNDLEARFHLSLGDAGRLAFEDHAFDRVVAFYVMSVLPDPQQALREMVRVCKPDGRIIFTNHFQRETGWLSKLEGLFSRYFVKVGFHTDIKLSDVLEGAPVEVDRVEGVNLFKYWTLCSMRPDHEALGMGTAGEGEQPTTRLKQEKASAA